jgi:hypothetical protein
VAETIQTSQQEANGDEQFKVEDHYPNDAADAIPEDASFIDVWASEEE